MRKVIISLGFLALATASQAQVGPAPARVLTKPMPKNAPAGQTFSTEAKLVLTPKGRVYLAEVTSSSGDESFDKQWPKSLSNWRFVPAVGEDGEPRESTVYVTYKNVGGVVVRTTAAGDTPAPNVISESDRIARLTCKDFLWEYEIVTDALPRRLALMDPLLKTPQAMLAADTPLSETQQTSLREQYDSLVSDAAKRCRDAPADLFWTGVFKPLLQSTLIQ